MLDYRTLEDLSTAYHEAPLALLSELANQGDWTVFRLGKRRAFLFTSPQYARSVLTCKDVKHSRYARVASRFVGNGILTSEGEFHRRQRKLIVPAFLPNQIAKYAVEMSRCIDEMLARWNDGNIYNMIQEMSDLSMRIVTLVLFGKEIPELENALLTVMREASRVAVGRSLSPSADWQMGSDGLSSSTFDSVIEAFINHSELSNDEDDRLISVLRNASDQDGPMSEQQLRDEIKSLLITGHRTTAATLTWTLYLLAQYPEEALELATALANASSLELSALEDMNILDCVINESLRLYPPAWVMTREPAEATAIIDVDVEKGDMLFVSPYATQRCARYFEQPDQFVSCRFVNRQENPAFFPFGVGPHVCIGQSFALAQLRLTLAKIYRHYHLILEPGATITAEPLGMLDPVGNLPMRVQHRS